MFQLESKHVSMGYRSVGFNDSRRREAHGHRLGGALAPPPPTFLLG